MSQLFVGYRENTVGVVSVAWRLRGLKLVFRCWLSTVIISLGGEVELIFLLTYMRVALVFESPALRVYWCTSLSYMAHDVWNYTYQTKTHPHPLLLIFFYGEKNFWWKLLFFENVVLKISNLNSRKVEIR